jgi:flagellar basal body P-ring formation protein FlgA
MRLSKKTRVFGLNAGECIFLLFILLLCCLTVFTQSKISVKILPEAIIEADTISLGDIAKISGLDEIKTNRLKTISLGYSPNIGMVREINKANILLSISAAGIQKTDLAIDSPEKIIVRRMAHKVEQSFLRETIEKAILAEFQRENVEAKLVKLDFSSNIEVPSGNLEVFLKTPPNSNPFLPFSVSLELKVDGKTFHRIYATIQIEASAEVLVAAKDLVAGSSVSEADFRKSFRKLERPLSNYLRFPEDLRGMIVVKGLSEGAEITIDAFAAGYVIRTGDPVKISAESGTMKIVVSGEARASGKIGDRIAVKNVQSGSMLQAIVVSEGLVRISF